MVDIAYAGPDQTTCFTETPVLAANSAGVGLGRWTVLSGNALFTDPLNPRTTITNVPVGTTELEWRISQDGYPTTRDTVIIEVLPFPSPALAGAVGGKRTTGAGVSAGHCLGGIPLSVVIVEAVT